MPTPARKRDQRPSGEEKVSPDPKIPRHQEDDHASNTENMAAAFHASAESSSPESNSDMKEIKEMLAVIQSQMGTVLSDNRKIQRDLETLKESMNMQGRELKKNTATTDQSGRSKRFAKEGIGCCSLQTQETARGNRQFVG